LYAQLEREVNFQQNPYNYFPPYTSSSLVYDAGAAECWTFIAVLSSEVGTGHSEDERHCTCWGAQHLQGQGAHNCLSV